MSSEPRRIRRRAAIAACFVAWIFACSTRETSVSCSPTLTCTLRDAQFDRPPVPDGGPAACAADTERCHAAKLAMGGAHSCAIAEGGEVVCWGSDSDGQRGDVPSMIGIDAGPDETRFSLRQGPATEITAGGAHTCIIRTDTRSVECWGREIEGQVVHALALAATDVSAGDSHTCAVTDGGVLCWGSSRFGQSGRTASDATPFPRLVPGTGGAAEVSAGARHTCARFPDGHVACWGELVADASGATHVSADPVDVPGLTDAGEISAGAGHTCAIRTNGIVVCWGANENGQLGDGTTTASAVPVEVAGIPLALHVSAGGAERDGTLTGHTCAVDTGFYVWCWGRNTEGQLGIGAADDQPHASLVLGRVGSDQPYLDNIVAVSTGGFHTCALDHDGPVRCWGDDTSHQLGEGDRDRPVPFGRAVRVSRFGRSR